MTSDCLSKHRLSSMLSFINEFFSEYKIILWCLLLFFLVWKTFYPCISNPFADYDDMDYVYNNQMVRSGLTVKSIASAFYTPVCGNWHPLTMISHELDWQIYGDHPWGHHLTSVILHCWNSVLMFVLLLRITGSPGKSFFVALFFGIHPLRVESVAWISERKDVLSTLFWMLAALAYANYTRGLAVNGKPTRRSYYLALLWFTCGLMSKPMVVTFPCVIFLLDFWPLGRWKPETTFKLIREKTPFLIISGIFCLITWYTQRDPRLPLSYLPLSTRLENVPVAYCRYLGKLFYPVDLAPFYSLPFHWGTLRVSFSLLLLLAISALIVDSGRRLPFMAVGWLWFLGTLVPVIGLTQAGVQSMADRYSYVPSVGIFILGVWLASTAASWWKIPAKTLPSIGVGIALACFMLTRVQISYWRDNEKLWRHAAAVTENNYVAYSIIGGMEMDRTNYDAAITNLQKSLAIKKYQPESQLNLGIALTAKNRLDEALAALREAVFLEPTNAENYKELAVTLAASGRKQEAVTNLTYALKLQPDYLEASQELSKLTNSVSLKASMK